ncbi:MAG: divergent polysaccharide deacetylase family protein, partial [Rhodobacteraceae bacterium]|nr:divergent polysaccharide deacetylase family protein [Paracoccaceae bacterium]
MGKGFLFGIVVGAIFSVLGLCAVSLMTPIETPVMVAATPADVAAPNAAPALAAAAPDTETPPVAPLADPVTAADGGTPAAATPEIAMVEIPAGSEFARAKVDGETVLPTPETVDVATAVPPVAAPEAEPAPALADLSPAAAPEGQAEAPLDMAAPDLAAETADFGQTVADNLAVTQPAALPAEAPVLASDAGQDTVIAADSTSESAAPAEPVPAVEPDMAAVPEAVLPAAAAPSISSSAPTALADVTPATPEPASAASVNGDAPIVVAVNEAPAASAPVEKPADLAVASETAVPATPPVVPVAEPEAPPVATPVADAPAAPAADTRVAEAATPAVEVPLPAPEPSHTQTQAILPVTPPAETAEPSFGQPVQPFGSATAPEPGFGGTVAGVKINRLPTISTEPAVSAEPEAEAAPATETAEAPADAADLPAFVRFAAPFDSSTANPFLSIVILDVGPEAGGLPSAELAAIGIPATIAISPDAPDARATADSYRAAGLEVAILAPALPVGATPSDLEVSYQSYVTALPESVAIVGAPEAQFLTNRRTAEHLAALLAADGRGLVTFARGLNPAGQAAEKEGVPHIAVYRVLDTDLENTTTIGRYLDRAAFEADRKGQILVMAHSYPESIAGLKDWIAGGTRGTTIAPASAAMLAG